MTPETPISIQPTPEEKEDFWTRMSKNDTLMRALGKKPPLVQPQPPREENSLPWKFEFDEIAEKIMNAFDLRILNAGCHDIHPSIHYDPNTQEFRHPNTPQFALQDALMTIIACYARASCSQGKNDILIVDSLLSAVQSKFPSIVYAHNGNRELVPGINSRFYGREGESSAFDSGLYSLVYRILGNTNNSSTTGTGDSFIRESNNITNDMLRISKEKNVKDYGIIRTPPREGDTFIDQDETSMSTMGSFGFAIAFAHDKQKSKEYLESAREHAFRDSHRIISEMFPLEYALLQIAYGNTNEAKRILERLLTTTGSRQCLTPIPAGMPQQSRNRRPRKIGKPSSDAVLYTYFDPTRTQVRGIPIQCITYTNALLATTLMALKGQEEKGVEKLL